MIWNELWENEFDIDVIDVVKGMNAETKELLKEYSARNPSILKIALNCKYNRRERENGNGRLLFHCGDERHTRMFADIGHMESLAGHVVAR